MPEKPIQIVIHEPAPARTPHPCELGRHKWAYAQLVRGGTRQVCYRCGTPR